MVRGLSSSWGGWWRQVQALPTLPREKLLDTVRGKLFEASFFFFFFFLPYTHETGESSYNSAVILLGLARFLVELGYSRKGYRV